MSLPLPLVLYGPITPLSSWVRATGVLPTATVKVWQDHQSQDSQPIGTAQATAPGEIWIGITQPKLGAQITVTQTIAEGTSLPSTPVLVTDVPSPLPIPMIASELNTCMTGVWIEGLVPGATVIGTIIPGVLTATTVASDTGGWLDFELAAAIAPDAVLSVQQRVLIDGIMRTSMSAKSIAIPKFVAADNSLPVPVLGPLKDCQTARQFLSVTPGAVTVIHNNDQQGHDRREALHNPSAAYNAYGWFPLQTGALTASQEMLRCNYKSKAVTLHVPAPLPPEAPRFDSALCPLARQFTLSGLEPGAVLTVSRVVYKAESPNTLLSTEEVGKTGIAYPTQQIALPDDLVLSEPGHIIFLSMTQSLCSEDSPPLVTPVPSSQDGQDGTPPKLQDEIYECARAVLVTTARIGSIIQVLEHGTNLPLSDPVGLTFAGSVRVPLWFPAVAGKKLFVRQTGCAPADSQAVTVTALQEKLPKLQFTAQPQTDTDFIKLADVRPGARVHVLVDQVLRTSVDAWVTDPTILLPKPLLTAGQQIVAVQTLCGLHSDPQDKIEVVAKGHLSVTASPTSVVRGIKTQIRVDAVNAMTRVPVAGKVFLHNQLVGQTGKWFSHTVKAGDHKPLAGLVTASNYNDKSFPIEVSEPVVPMWTLVLGIWLPPQNPAIAIRFDKVTWKITPKWDSNLAFEKTSNGGHTQTVHIPMTAGANKKVDVEVTIPWEVSGGTFGPSLNIQSQVGVATIAQNPVTVSYENNTTSEVKNVTWWIKVSPAEDSYGNVALSLSADANIS